MIFGVPLHMWLISAESFTGGLGGSLDRGGEDSVFTGGLRRASQEGLGGILQVGIEAWTL